MDRTESIRQDIDATRASLDRKLAQLQTRARRLHPRNYSGWIAMVAVLTGVSLGLKGWLSRRPREGAHEPLPGGVGMAYPPPL